MPIASLIAISVLAGVLFILNANHYARRRYMSDTERKADDEALQKFTDDGW